ncbi:MAG: hypothetical protein IMW94_06620 [Thermoanaerobacter sp.]|nr:hypothetical protein [Thermoanaerobacter sp.]
MAILSDREAMNVIRNFLQTRGEDGATEEEIKTIVAEVSSMKTSGILANLIIEGKVSINLVNGEVVVGITEAAGGHAAD